ncbi:hypothetical protein ABPG72_020153 [Tetrahymena utriculariae]
MFGAADAKNQFIFIPEFNTLAECKQTLTRYLMSQIKTIYSDTQRFFQNKYSAQTRNSKSCEYEERPFQILEDIGSLKNIYRHTGVMCFVFELQTDTISFSNKLNQKKYKFECKNLHDREELAQKNREDLYGNQLFVACPKNAFQHFFNQNVGQKHCRYYCNKQSICLKDKCL